MMTDIPRYLALIVILGGFNILASGAFVYDKLTAKSNSRRTPENTLLLLAAFGPLGALFAMYGVRHKTRHVKFYLVWLFAVLQLGLIVWLWPWLA
jgi:uncharacterized membrane protein YsdA (DUF1294 family)